MKITFDVTKSLEENASDYYQKAKEARKKLVKVEETLATFRKKKEQLEAAQGEAFAFSYKKITPVHHFWFEKFKWFITSEGFLVIGGRDATTNEIIVKKHTDADDLVFHTDMAGSPFVVIKKNSSEDVQKLLPGQILPAQIGEASIQEAANFCAIHSRAWKQGLTTTDTFFVTPSQVTKEANAGESLSRGSFVIRGKTTYVPVDLGFGVGVVAGEEPFLLSGPLRALTRCETFVTIEQGRDKASAVAKQVRLTVREATQLDLDLDEIIRHLPSGGVQIKKERKRKSK